MTRMKMKVFQLFRQLSLSKATKMICMLMFMLLFATHAMAHEFQYRGIYYTVKDDGTARCDGFHKAPDQSVKEIIIPDYVYEGDIQYAVTEIKNYAFNYQVVDVWDNITRVVIGDNVTTIGVSAFGKFGYRTSNCELVIGKNVKKMGSSPFEFYSYQGKNNVVILKCTEVPEVEGAPFSSTRNAAFYVRDEGTYNKFMANAEWKKYEYNDYHSGNVNCHYVKSFPMEHNFKEGVWVTAMFPESMTAEQIAEMFGRGTKVAKMSADASQYNISEEQGEQLGVVFNLVDAITDNTPYLIKVGNKESCYVSLKEFGEGEHAVSTNAYASGKFVKMIGVNTNYMLHRGDIYFRNTGSDMLFYAAAANNEVGLRKGKCYFQVVKPSGEQQLDDVRLSIVYNATGISGPSVMPHQTQHKVYNLNGQRETEDISRLPKGIHIIGGKKYVVR